MTTDHHLRVIDDLKYASVVTQTYHRYRYDVPQLRPLPDVIIQLIAEYGPPSLLVAMVHNKPNPMAYALCIPSILDAMKLRADGGGDEDGSNGDEQKKKMEQLQRQRRRSPARGGAPSSPTLTPTPTPPTVSAVEPLSASSSSTPTSTPTSSSSSSSSESVVIIERDGPSWLAPPLSTWTGWHRLPIHIHARDQPPFGEYQREMDPLVPAGTPLGRLTPDILAHHDWVMNYSNDRAMLRIGHIPYNNDEQVVNRIRYPQNLYHFGRAWPPHVQPYRLPAIHMQLVDLPMISNHRLYYSWPAWIYRPPSLQSSPSSSLTHTSGGIHFIGFGYPDDIPFHEILVPSVTTREPLSREGTTISTNSSSKLSADAASHWHRNQPHPSMSRQYAAIVNHGPLIIIMGGVRHEQVQTSCECYNVNTKKWLPPDSFPPLINARQRAFAFVIKDTIYVMGGSDSLRRPVAPIEVLNRKKKCWDVAPWSLPKMITMAFARVVDDWLVIILGDEVYTKHIDHLKDAAWIRLPSTPWGLGTGSCGQDVR